MKEKIYTAPAVVASTDAVQTTKGILVPPDDGGEPKSEGAPGTVGFYL